MYPAFSLCHPGSCSGFSLARPGGRDRRVLRGHEGTCRALRHEPSWPHSPSRPVTVSQHPKAVAATWRQAPSIDPGPWRLGVATSAPSTPSAPVFRAASRAAGAGRGGILVSPTLDRPRAPAWDSTQGQLVLDPLLQGRVQAPRGTWPFGARAEVDHRTSLHRRGIAVEQGLADHQMNAEIPTARRHVR